MSSLIPHKAQFVLRFLNGSQKGKSVRLLSSELKIGSSSSCDLILKSRSISAYHAHFKQTDSSYIVSSADPNNPVLVNKAPIQSHILQVKDEIQIGKLILVFLEKPLSAKAPQPTAPPVKKKKFLSPPRLIFALVILGAFGFLLSNESSQSPEPSNTKSQSPNSASDESSSPQNPEEKKTELTAEEIRLNQIEALKQQSEKELEEMTLDFKEKGARTAFIAGFRDYRKGYFKRALGYFKHCSTIDKNNKLCRRYELKSQSQIDRLIQQKIRIGNAYKDKKQYSACEATFRSVEAMLEDSSSPIYKEAKAKRQSCSIHLRNKI